MTKSKDFKKNEISETTFWLSGIVIVVLMFLLIITFPTIMQLIVSSNCITIEQSTKMGTFGDMYGSLNALFSGFAFLGIIITLYYQRQELELQRKEMREQREVFNLQREEMAKSAESQMKMESIMIDSALVTASKSINDITTEVINSTGMHNTKSDIISNYSSDFIVNSNRKSFKVLLEKIKILNENKYSSIFSEYKNKLENINVNKTQDNLWKFFRILSLLDSFLESFIEFKNCQNLDSAEIVNFINGFEQRVKTLQGCINTTVGINIVDESNYSKKMIDVDSIKEISDSSIENMIDLFKNLITHFEHNTLNLLISEKYNSINSSLFFE